MELSFTEYQATQKYRPGDKYRVDYGEGHPFNRKVHILAIVESQIVWKHWSARRGGSIK